MLGLYTSDENQLITPLIKVRVNINTRYLPLLSYLSDNPVLACKQMTYINDRLYIKGNKPFITGNFRVIHYPDIERYGLTYCLRKLNKSLTCKSDRYDERANKIAKLYGLGFLSQYERLYKAYFPELVIDKNIYSDYKIVPNFIIKERIC